MSKYLPKINYCGLSGKPCYDKKGALTVVNSRWKRDRVKLRAYQCCYSHWHVTKQVRFNKTKKRKYNKDYSRKGKNKNYEI